MDHNSRKRPYHHGGLHEALVEAGIAILNEGSLEKFTLRECARRVGVSHAAPKNHFTTLDDLKAEICARGFEQLVREQQAAASAVQPPSPEGRLIAMGHAYVRFACANPAIYMMMFRDRHAFAETAHYRQAAEASWAQIHDAVADVVGEGKSAGARAAQAWALVHGFASLMIDGRLPAGLTTEAVIAEGLESFTRSLSMLGTG